MRQATTLASIPERRSAHAVSATPPAPAAANRRVAATPGHGDLVARAPVDRRVCRARRPCGRGPRSRRRTGARRRRRRPATPACRRPGCGSTAEVPPEIWAARSRGRRSPRATKSAEDQRPLTRDDHARHLLVVGVLRLCDVALVDAAPNVMRAPAPRAAGASGSPRAAPARRGGPGGARPRRGPAPASEVDDVVLAEVDEREPERQRHRTTPARPGPARRRRGRGRPSRRWRSAARAWRREDCLPGHRREAPRRPSRPPRPCSTHQAAHAGLARVRGRPPRRGVPRRRGRERPVADEPEVETA